MFRHLLRPLSYLSIEHKQKWVVDWVYPGFGCSISWNVVLLEEIRNNRSLC